MNTQAENNERIVLERIRQAQAKAWKEGYSRGRDWEEGDNPPVNPYSEQPKWVDLLGAAPDFTGGQDVNDYLDESRSEA